VVCRRKGWRGAAPAGDTPRDAAGTAPEVIAIDGAGNIFVSNNGTGRIRVGCLSVFLEHRHKRSGLSRYQVGGRARAGLRRPGGLRTRHGWLRTLKAPAQGRLPRRRLTRAARTEATSSGLGPAGTARDPSPAAFLATGAEDGFAHSVVYTLVADQSSLDARPARTLGNLGWRGKPLLTMIGFARSSPRSRRRRYSCAKGYRSRSGHGCQNHSGGVCSSAGSSIAHQPPTPSGRPSPYPSEFGLARFALSA